MRSRRNYSLSPQFVSESVAKTFSDEKRKAPKAQGRRRKEGRALSARVRRQKETTEVRRKNGATGRSDIEGKAAQGKRQGSEGSDRVSIKKEEGPIWDF
jgi:hypothetical protein